MPLLAPASKSPLLATTLPLTPLPKTATPIVVASTSVASAKPSMDAKVEYMDVNGVLRRSATITNRMVCRGHSINKALVLQDDEQLHRSLETRSSEERRRQSSLSDEMDEIGKMQQANAEFKRKCKDERRQRIEDGDEFVATRLHLWYETALGKAPEDDAVDLTEHHTALSPSKKAQAFVDCDGNVRRKSSIVVATSRSTLGEATLGTTATKVKDVEKTIPGKQDMHEAIRPADIATTTAVAPPPAPPVVVTTQ